MAKFYVRGGEHTDTTFIKLVEGKGEEYGPFDTYEEAEKVWREKTWWKVDICNHRLMIVEEKE